MVPNKGSRRAPGKAAKGLKASGDSTLDAFESYILSGGNVEEGLKHLVKGSEEYNSLFFLDLLKRQGAKLNAQEEADLEKYLKESQSPMARKLRVWYDFLRYSPEKSKAQKDAILDELNRKYLRQGFDFHKPVLYAKQNVEEAKEAPRLAEVDWRAELSKVFDKPDLIHNVSISGLRLIDPMGFKTVKDFIEFMKKCGQDVVTLPQEPFFKRLKVELDQFDEYLLKNNTDLDGDVPKLPGRLSNEQLERLIALAPKVLDDTDFFSSYVAKKMYKELDGAGSAAPNAERKANLQKLLEESAKWADKHPGMRSVIMLEQLYLGEKMDEWSKTLLIDYLKAPYRSYRWMLKQEHKDKNKIKWDNVLNQALALAFTLQQGKSLETMDSELLDRYLIQLHRAGAKKEDFAEVLDPKFLSMHWDEVKLVSGEPLEVRPKWVDRVEEITKETRLIICPHNKSEFAVGEEPAIELDLKNVNALSIKVFEVNIEGYYRRNKMPFNIDTNMDGLTPSFERIMEFKNPSYLIFRTAVKFPEIAGKAGVFLIDFNGNGRHSRAVLKIGSLSYVAIPSILGQEYYLLDSKMKVCVPSKETGTTGILIEDDLFAPDATGRIIVPYVFEDRSMPAILLHNKLATLVELTRRKEHYTMNCSFFLFPESMLMGNQATVAIRPYLYLNDCPAPASLITKAKCSVIFTNSQNEVHVTKTYENLTVGDNEETKVTFEVPANISEVRMEFSGLVRKTLVNQQQTLTSSYTLPIQTHKDDSLYFELYLRNSPKDGYQILVLGKNGEPISDIPLTLHYYSDLQNSEVSLKAASSKSGAVQLGFLPYVARIRAEAYVDYASSSRTWILPSPSFVRYPPRIDIISGEAVTLPNAFPEESLFLFLYNKSSPVEDCGKFMKLKPQRKGEACGEITIAGLHEGSYRLWGPTALDMKIVVHRGEVWPLNKKFIMTAGALIERSNLPTLLPPPAITLGEKGELTIHVGKGARTHLVLFNFIPANLNMLTCAMVCWTAVRNWKNPMQRAKNYYLSNQEMNSELRYTFGRKTMKRFTGNMLEKPPLLIRRNFMQICKSTGEQSTAGTAFEGTLVEDQAAPPSVEGFSYPALPSSGNDDTAYWYQNFLKHSPMAMWNMVADETGNVRAQIDPALLRAYSGMYVVSLGKEGVSHSFRSLDCDGIEKRDLALRTPLDAAKSFSELRTTKCILKNESYIFDDIASAETQIVDSLEKVLAVQTELIKSKALDKFRDLVHWNSLPRSKKVSIFSQYYCHEMNLFISKKDPEFFKTVVRPFIQNKMEKTFIDHYLLRSAKVMKKYATRVGLYEKLNYLEKSLLVEFVATDGDLAVAKVLAQRLTNELLPHKISIQEQQLVFGLILSLNLGKSKEGNVFCVRIRDRTGGDDGGGEGGCGQGQVEEAAG